MGNLSFGVTRLGTGISCLLELSLPAERLSSMSGVRGDTRTPLLRLTTRKPRSLQPRGAVSMTPTPHTAPGHAAWLLWLDTAGLTSTSALTTLAPGHADRPELRACSVHCLWALAAVRGATRPLCAEQETGTQ